MIDKTFRNKLTRCLWQKHSPGKLNAAANRSYNKKMSPMEQNDNWPASSQSVFGPGNIRGLRHGEGRLSGGSVPGNEKSCVGEGVA